MSESFHSAVVGQVRRLGGDAERAAGAVSRLLSPDYDAGSPIFLAADPVLLSALFQNIDLLYAEGHPAADAVARAVMAAIEEMEGGAQ